LSRLYQILKVDGGKLDKGEADGEEVDKGKFMP
jgi:hypothetical protein